MISSQSSFLFIKQWKLVLPGNFLSLTAVTTQGKGKQSVHLRTKHFLCTKFWVYFNKNVFL